MFSSHMLAELVYAGQREFIYLYSNTVGSFDSINYMAAADTYYFGTGREAHVWTRCCCTHSESG